MVIKLKNEMNRNYKSICLSEANCCGGKYDTKLDIYEQKAILKNRWTRKVFRIETWEKIEKTIRESGIIPFEITSAITLTGEESQNLLLFIMDNDNFNSDQVIESTNKFNGYR